LVSTFYKVNLYTVLSTCNEVTFFLQISTFYFVNLLATMHVVTEVEMCALSFTCQFWTQFPPSESDDGEDAFFRSTRRPHVNVQDVVANYLHDASDTLASLDIWPSLKPKL